MQGWRHSSAGKMLCCTLDDPYILCEKKIC